MLSLGIYVVFLLANPAFPYTKVPTDYDRYGIKVALNDRLLVYSDNLFAVWYMEVLTNGSDLSCMISFNLTSCDYVYSVATPVSNNSSFVYNCIDGQGNNVIGAIAHIDQCTFVSIDERIVPVNATQDNFVIDLNQQGTGVYGFADDFFLYYELQPVPQLTVWPNALGISPRAVDIGWSNDYAVIVGYCQVTVLKATECGYVMRLNKALACPYATSNFSFVSVLKYPWSDPRAAHFIAQNRMYTAQLVMSVSVAWRAQLVLIGVQSLNKVLLFALNDTIQPIGIRQSGVGFMGYGKSVAWLDDDGHRAMILANVYTYATYLWVSSSIHVYDVQSDGFANTTQPIFIYPNSQQILHPTLVPSLLRLTSSPTGSVGIFDILGNGVVIIKAPAGSYPITNISQSVSVSVPCTLGTHRDYEGIEVCAPCSSSSHCSLCTSTDSFCPPGAVGEITHADFESIEQEQEYPESPENTVFDDLLMQNMFMMNIRSSHCTLVSPLTWVLVIIGIGCSVAIGMAISELVCPHKHSMRNRAKNIFRRMDLVGEGELWFGGLVSAAIFALVVSAFYFSNSFLHQYPIEEVKDNSSFACDVTLRNAKFSTSIQKVPSARHSSNVNQPIFDLLKAQAFTLNIDLIQTAFTCDDALSVERLYGYQYTSLPITRCEKTHNETILSVGILLPAHDITVQLVLPGLKTVGAIRLGLHGSAAELHGGRYTLRELKFASTFYSASVDQILAPSVSFPIALTPVVNHTAPLNIDELSKFIAIWASSFNVNLDELFTNESRYTFFRRAQTNISVAVNPSIFYESNLQQPIARQTEIIFRNLLFTIVVLEVFGLVFLLVKLLLVPVFRKVLAYLHERRARRTQKVEPANEMTIVVHENRPVSTSPRPSVISCT